MRRRILSVSLLAALAAAGCTDLTPTGTELRPGGLTPLGNLAPAQSLSDFIDQEIREIFKQGHRTAVTARWDNVKRRKAAADLEGAKKHFIQLAEWMTKKVEVDPAPPPEEERAFRQRLTRLVYAMSLFVYVGESVPVPVIGPDSKVEVVPAGEPATVVTESERAGVDLEAGSTAEDRVIVVAEEPTRYLELCSGPLPTPLCQYPLFYKFESFPNLTLSKAARFSVCMVTAATSARRPLEYESDDPRWTEENRDEIDRRLRLAHNRAPGGPKTPGGITKDERPEIGDIEILPRAVVQKGFTHCDEEPIDYAIGRDALFPAAARGGWLGRAHRALLAVANFAGRLVTPKDLYALDWGPEFESISFSSFNPVDPASQPDLKPEALSAPAEVFRGDQATVAYSVTNKSRRQPDGDGTASSHATTASVYLIREIEVEGQGSASTEEVRLCDAEDNCAFAATAFRPDDPAHSVTEPLQVPEDVEPGEWFVEVRVSVNAPLGEVHVTNNILRSAQPIRIKKKLPDLAFRSGFTLTSATTVAPGGTITTSSWTVENTGNTVSGQFDARFYLRSAAGALRALGGAITHNSIGFQSDANSATHDGVELTIPSDVQPGTYSVLLRLDPGNDVEEFRDDNNEAAPQQLVVQQPISLNLSAVEKLPGGTQRFVVQDGGTGGPYTWSVNGIDGGNATFGTITPVSTNAADYKAPAAVPDPSTFDVCARPDAAPATKACAEVTIRPVPTSGADVIVFNDLNMFDNTGAAEPNNRILYANLVTYTGSGPRATQRRVLVHRGHSSRCVPTNECTPGSWSTFENTMRNATGGYTVHDVNDATAPLSSSIPSDVKVLILVLPMTNYSTAEINSLKEFAGEGGRIVFVGEWDGYYGAGIGVENAFLTNMGAVMRNTGGAIDCGFNTIPKSSLRDHQVMAGLVQLRIACASVVEPGPNDYALFYDKAGTRVLGAVAKVDLTPLSSLAAASSLTPSLSQAPSQEPDPNVHSWGVGPAEEPVNSLTTNRELSSNPQAPPRSAKPRPSTRRRF